MPPDLNRLGNVSVQDVPTQSSYQRYLAAYTQKYEALVSGIRRAVQIIRQNYNPNFGNQQIVLGAFELSLNPDKDQKEPLHVELPPNRRFYPPEIGRLRQRGNFNRIHTKIPQAQLERLVSDLNTFYQRRGGVPGENPTYVPTDVYIGHRVGIWHGQPSEDISLTFNIGPYFHVPLSFTGNSPVSEVGVKNEGFGGGDINRVLAEFDFTPSGLHIPIGYNRLALLDAVLRHLVSQIRKGEKLTADLTVRLDGLFPSESARLSTH